LCWQLGFASHKAVDAALVAVAGPSQPPLLLTGPVGYGPERLARAIHTHSGCRDLPLVTISARAPRRVVEAELARAGAGAVCVDLRGVRRAGAALVDNLFRTSARVITFGDDARSMRHALDWHGYVAEIRSPAIVDRPPGEAIAMLDVALAEQESMHRVAAPGPLWDLLGPRGRPSRDSTGPRTMTTCDARRRDSRHGPMRVVASARRLGRWAYMPRRCERHCVGSASWRRRRGAKNERARLRESAADGDERAC
jgi:hypothetical protein